MFYTNISSCVINNGVASKQFFLSRGVRQGDPLSPYLFTLAVELLSIAVRNDNLIKGIKIESKEWSGIKHKNYVYLARRMHNISVFVHICLFIFQMKRSKKQIDILTVTDSCFAFSNFIFTFCVGFVNIFFTYVTI